MINRTLGFSALVLLLGLQTTARAENDPSLLPEIGELSKGAMLFDGTSTARLKLSRPMDLTNGLAFETWVLPNWSGAALYDPCVMALRSSGTVMFSLRVGKSRDTITIQSGDTTFTYPAVLPAKKISHLAVASFGEYSEITINGEPSGLISLQAPVRTADTLEIGGCSGAGANFAGSLAESRLWNTWISLDDILSFEPVTGDLSTEDSPYQLLLQAQLTSNGNRAVLIERNASLPGATP